MKYCPHCNASRLTLLLFEGESEERCAACGFPFQVAARLEQPVPVLGTKVLCIDDDPLIRQLLTITLQRNGFHPLSAPDGLTGIAMAVDEHPRLILVDIMMPGMDGYEVCCRLKADPRTATIPLIILTATADAKLNVKAFQAGADLALTKPFAPDKLIATVQATLALKAGRPAPSPR